MALRKGPSVLLFLLSALLMGTGPFAGSPRSAEADSWLAPQPKLAASPDGGWYVIVQAEMGYSDVRFQLVRRADGAKARRAPASSWGGRQESAKFRPDKGDTLVASGTCHMPLELRCLNGGKGFLLFETYGQLGGRNVIERRDGAGNRVWSLGLTDLFAAEVIRARFTHSVSSIWWHVGFWVDDARDEIGVVARGKPYPSLLQLSLSKGERGALDRSALLRPLTGGSGAERVLALENAQSLDVPGLLAAARVVFADASAPSLARAHCALYLRTKGDASGEAYLVSSARSSPDVEVRRFAVKHLHEVMGAKAIPLLKQSMLDADLGVQDAAAKGFQQLGEPAVDTLVEMMGDASASEAYRLGAMSTLRFMGYHAARALPALVELAKGKDVRLAREAGSSRDYILKAVAKHREDENRTGK